MYILGAVETILHSIKDMRIFTPRDALAPSVEDYQIYGTIIIFWSFTVVQLIFQALPPNFYWGSELIYCALSLTAKLYLGWFLLLNVVLTDNADGTAEGGLAGDSTSRME